MIYIYKILYSIYIYYKWDRFHRFHSYVQLLERVLGKTRNFTPQQQENMSSEHRGKKNIRSQEPPKNGTCEDKGWKE